MANPIDMSKLEKFVGGVVGALIFGFRHKKKTRKSKKL